MRLSLSLTIFLLSCFTMPANAQILDMIGTKDKLNVPPEFLSNLYDCTPFETTVKSAPDGVVTKMIYRVVGFENEKCVMQIDGYTNVNVHITQKCIFTHEQAQTYANAVFSFQNKGYYSYKEFNLIEKDPDYIAASAIMTNSDICRFHRDEIDLTPVFRKKLTACETYEEVQHLDSVDITRKIVQKNNDICKLQITFTQNLPDLRLRADKITPELQKHIDNFKPANYNFNCAFNQEKKNEYLAVLQSLVVPEEEGFDFSAVQRYGQDSEFQFIFQNCEFLVK